MDKIIFATTNEGKMKEIRMILGDLGAEILSLKEAGISVDIVEDGKTFEENAVIKATEIQKRVGGIVLADDSGLEVDYLGGEPGVYSARYMGENTSYDIKNQTIIDRLKDACGDERSARFVCAIAAAFPDGRVETTKAAIEGQIAYEICGSGGFGYDPIFFIPELGKTSAEISADEKNLISHRGKALREMKKIIRNRI